MSCNPIRKVMEVFRSPNRVQIQSCYEFGSVMFIVTVDGAFKEGPFDRWSDARDSKVDWEMYYNDRRV